MNNPKSIHPIERQSEKPVALIEVYVQGQTFGKLLAVGGDARFLGEPIDQQNPFKTLTIPVPEDARPFSNLLAFGSNRRIFLLDKDKKVARLARIVSTKMDFIDAPFLFFDALESDETYDYRLPTEDELKDKAA